MAAILLGPLLGYEGQWDQIEIYTVCFLSDMTVTNPLLEWGEGPPLPFQKITNTPGGRFWRVELHLDPQKHHGPIDYHISSREGAVANAYADQWQFHVLEPDAKPVIAYASCNGFGYAHVAKNTPDPYMLWRTMEEMHREQPFSLLIMGGDQIYADQVWDLGLAPKIKYWPRIRKKKRARYKVDDTFHAMADRFYQNLYLDQWSNQHMTAMMASIPSVMMWDDHDIFDGWGSFPDELQHLPVYETLFHYALHYFMLFQIRSDQNRSLFQGRSKHYSCGLQYRDYHILALDQRTNRTRARIMDMNQWQDMRSWIVSVGKPHNVLVLCAVPVIYRSFAFIEWLFRLTSRIEEFEDDVQDHWSCSEHRDERETFVKDMLDLAERATGKVAILSGDVHVGGVGLIRDQERDLSVLQVISSAIVNQPPSRTEWLMIKTMTSDDKVLYRRGNIRARMTTAEGAPECIRTRNFSVIRVNDQNQMEVKWICESSLEPVYRF